MHASRAALDDRRWHFQHGPIDLVIGADGEASCVRAALEDAWTRFATVLPELVAELPMLRRAVGTECALRGPVARRMWQACAPYHPDFLTPMAAVAGSVAETILECFVRPGVRRAWVNNGGDIALHLVAGERLVLGVCSDPRRPLPVPSDRVSIDAADPVRGVATSGWRGRSFSLGIADAVTVLADRAADADAAATMIGNQVTVEHVAIVRRPANAMKDDTDLGDRLVTVAVGALPVERVDEALARGARFARDLIDRGRVRQVVLSLQGRSAIVGAPAPAPGSHPALPRLADHV